MATAKRDLTNPPVQGHHPQTDAAPSERLMTLREVADRLAVSTKTVYRLKNEGALAHLKVRGSLRFREVDVEALEARCLVTGDGYAGIEHVSPPRLNLQFEVTRRGRGPRRS